MATDGTYTVWSQHFLTDTPPDPALCWVDETDWRLIHEEHPTAKRIFARIERDDQVFFCALGSPVRATAQSEDFRRAVFLPTWLLDQLALPGAGEPFKVEWMTEEVLPEATKIVLRPQDSAFYHADAKEELEAALTRYGVVHRGSTILIPLSCLGGFEVPFDVVHTEPANILLTEGDEVAIDFEGALDEAPMDIAQPAAAPGRPSDVRDWSGSDTTFDDEDTSMAGAAVLPPIAPMSTGYRLGGSTSGATRLVNGRPWNPWRDGPLPKAAPPS